VRSLPAILVLLLLSSTWAHSGERVSLKGNQPVALSQARVKSIVAEFLDPDKKGLGVAAAIVIGGELLDAVSDVEGAGVLVATDREHDGILDRLGKGYHRAALEVAREQRAIVAAWGVVEEVGPNLLLESYATQVPDSGLGSVRLDIEWGGRPLEGFGTVLPPRSFHFRPRTVPKSALFQRRLVVQNGRRTVHKSPTFASDQVAALEAGSSVVSDTLVGSWWHVQLADGQSGWMEDHPNIVRVPPVAIDADDVKIQTFGGPDGVPERTVKLVGAYRVVDAAYTKTGRWLRIGVPMSTGKPGAGLDSVWVRTELLRMRYTLPIVHFLAGLISHRSGRYAEAARDFDACILQADEEDNVVLAAAYQLRGLSGLEAGMNDRSTLGAFDRAVDLTPFDSRAHSTRALATITSRSEIQKVSIADLSTALELDPGDRLARSLVFAMKGLLARPSAEIEAYGPIGQSLRAREEDIARLYGRAAALSDTAAWTNPARKESPK